MAVANPNTAELLTPTLADVLSPQDPKKKLLLALALQGADTSPVQSWTQGAARMANSLMGNYGLYQDEQDQRAREAKIQAALAADPLLGGSGVPGSVSTDTGGNSVPKLFASLFGGGQPPPSPANAVPMGGIIGQPAPVAPMVAPVPPMAPGRPSPLPPALLGPTGPSDVVALPDTAASATARPEVMPSATIWGDKEAQAAGLYPPDTGPNVPARDAAYAIGKQKLASALAGQPVPPVAAAGASPATTAAVPPSAVVPPVAQPGAAAPISPVTSAGRVINAPPPEEAAYIQRLLSDPATRAVGMQRLQKYAAPKEQLAPLTDPAQRAQYGIGPEDKTPYQIDLATKKVTPLNPQPFQVNVNQQQEAEFKKKAGSLQAERYDEIVKSGYTARQLGSDIQTLRDLGTTFKTGKEAEIKAAIGPYAQALGIDVKDLPAIQAYESVINRIAPSLRQPGSGAQSDFELRNFVKSLPALGTTPEGNAIVSRVTEGMVQNKMAAAEIASKALNGEINKGEADKAIRELPDPLKEWREYVRKNPDATKLQSGNTTSTGVKWSIQ